jgi:hypothetical protein
MDPQLKETSIPPASPSEKSSEPCTPPSEHPQDVAPQPSEANHETKSDTKKNKKKESNATYYKKIRERLAQADVSTLEPEPATPSTPPVKPPKPPKPRAKKAKPKQEESSEPEEPIQLTPPASPRTRMIEAYREARLADQERKRLRYKSWFN